METSESPAPARLKDRNRTPAGARRYRSKAERPCDLCRSRKVLCNIPDPTKPCQLCDRTSRPCTFTTVGSGKAQRVRAANTASREHVSPETGRLSSPQQNEPGNEEFSAGFANSQFLGSPGDFLPSLGQIFANPGAGVPVDAQWQDAVSHIGDGFAPQPTSANTGLPEMQMPDLWSMQDIEPPIGNMDSPATQSSTAPSASSPTATGDLSLNLTPKMSSWFIGYSNESDPFLLEHYPYNTAGELDFFKVRYRRPSPNDVASGWPPVHFLQSQAQYVAEGQEHLVQCIDLHDERQLLKELVDVETGIALLRL